MDIHAEWDRLQTANAGEIMAFTMAIVREYWRYLDLAEIPENKIELADAYRKEAMSGDYRNFKVVSAEFILEQTGIDLRVP